MMKSPFVDRPHVFVTANTGSAGWALTHLTKFHAALPEIGIEATFVSANEGWVEGTWWRHHPSRLHNARTRSVREKSLPTNKIAAFRVFAKAYAKQSPKFRPAS